MRRVTVESLSGLRCAYHIAAVGEGAPAVLVVSFAGAYGHGSRGNGDGAFIRAETMRGLAAFDACALVLDLREMSYQWGNTLLSVFQAVGESEDAIPIVIASSERCHDAIVSLLGPGAAETIFLNFDSALAAADAAARAWLED